MTTSFNGTKSYNATLKFSDLKSHFEYVILPKDSARIETTDKNGNSSIVISDKRQQIVILDFIKNKIFETKYLRSKAFCVEDTLVLPQWYISEEVKIINKLSCRKATSKIKGRKYEVWFAMDFPSKSGPWKLVGLPGLIISAQDDRGEVFFEALSIAKTNEPELQSQTYINIVSATNYKKEFLNWQNDLIERMNASSSRDLKVSIKFGNATGIEIIE